MNLDTNDIMEDFSIGDSRGESNKKGSKKRVKDKDELAMYFHESTKVLRVAITYVADATGTQKTIHT